MGVDAFEDVFDIFPGVDLQLPAGCAEGHEDRRGIPAVFTTDKQPIFAA